MKPLTDVYKELGRMEAERLQTEADLYTGTELYLENDRIPDFKSAVKNMNMLKRPVGFLCRSSSGRLVKLIQPYDSNTFTGEPETLPAQFGFVWSTNPEDALPFIALSTSPYNKGECCTDGGKTYRAKRNGIVHSPHDLPDAWTRV